MAALLAWESLCSCGLIIFKAGQQLFGFFEAETCVNHIGLDRIM